MRIQARPWLHALLTVMFSGIDGVSFAVSTKGSERDGCVGATVRYDGWNKTFRIPIAMVNDEDMDAVFRAISAQNLDRAVPIISEQSLHMLRSEGVVHH